MADEEKTQADPSADAAPPAKKSSLLPLIAVGVGAMVIGIVLAMFVFAPSSPSESADSGAEEHTEAVAEESHGGGGEEESGHGSSSSSHGGGATASQAAVYQISDIVVNPAGTGGSRFLSVSFGFELSPEAAQQFTGREPLVRDALITILASKTVAQLSDIKQKEIIRYQIKKRLEMLLETEGIDAVYYTDFVMQ